MAKRRKQEEEIIEPIEEVVFHEQFKEDFVEYGLYAIGSRAVPDVRDGLKPVQRRIIYGADKLGARAGGPYMKSARITGDVMGKYHPHGDCLDGDTEVLLGTDQYVAIRHLYAIQQDDPDAKFPVYAIDPSTGELVNAEASHVRIGQVATEIYVVRLSNGGEMRMTSNHPVMLHDLSFVKAENLAVGMQIKALGTGKLNTYYTQPGKMKAEEITITSIQVVETESTPMYDFTVEGYENAIFKAGDSNVCLHNSSIYEAAVNMAQWWKSTLTLVDGDGNWGNQQGQDAAAPRYTEMRLSKFGQLFVRDLAPGVVPFVPNYSNDLTEPTVLPVPFPYLLIAGSAGILTVGISANIPPHNAREVMAAVLAYIKNPRISDAKLLELIPGPDFPTAGTVLNKDEGQAFYLTGKGKFLLRGETERDKKMVVITEVPFTETGKIKAFQVSVDDLIFSKRILAATGAKNYSNKAGVRIEVGLKRESTPETLEAELYAKTRLQGNYFGNFTALRNGVPHVFTLREYLSDYVSFQYELLENRSTVAIAKLRADLEIQTGLRTALDDINVIIELIQNTKKEADVLKCLTTGAVPDGAFKTKAAAKVASKFRFSEAQAAYILDTRLRRLNSLDRVAMERKIASMEKEIARLEKILSDPAAAKKELIKLQTEVAKIFEAPEFDRKTRLTNDGPITYVEEKKVVSYEVSVDKFGYLRMMAPGAAAVANEVTRFATDTEQKVGFFASDGAYHTVRVDKLKQSKPTDKGDTLASLGGLSGTTWPLVNSTMQAGGDQTLVFVTARGLIKSTTAAEYLSSRTRLAGPALKDGDELVSVLNLDKAKYLVLVTSAGRAKRLAVSDIPAMSRKAAGNQSGRMLDGEAVVAAFLGDAKSEFELGGKKHKFSDLPVDKPSTAFKKI